MKRVLTMTLFKAFSRVEILHLPHRADRYSLLKRELAACGFDISDAAIPAPVMPEDANGFPSKAVYGNFLSHLGALKRAYNDGLKSVLIMEDDAIFSRLFRREQQAIANNLNNTPWDIVYIGHSISDPIRGGGALLAPFQGEIVWAHCYGVHRNAMPRLISHLETAADLPAGGGGKMYIDAGLSIFRRQNPDIITLVSHPCLSVQRGSESSIAAASPRSMRFPRATQFARSIRDELWRCGLVKISHKHTTPPENQQMQVARLLDKYSNECP